MCLFVLLTFVSVSVLYPTSVFLDVFIKVTSRAQNWSKLLNVHVFVTGVTIETSCNKLKHKPVTRNWR